MRKCFLAAAVLGCLLIVSALSGDDKDKQDHDKTSFWMKQKLSYAQNILNGLAIEDFDLIAKNAEAMKGLNQVEYFVRRKPEGYRTQLRTFQYATEEILGHAQKENLDGATLAFTQLTVSCVNCHKQMRSP